MNDLSRECEISGAKQSRNSGRLPLAVATAIFTLNYVDRGLIILLLEPIKRDLQLTDTQLGFVTGIAFGLFYAILGLPIARWADRGDRVTIASIAIGLWGVTVMACLAVTNFAQLALARLAAGVGEAGCMPPTYSLIGDYYPEPADRTRAMAIYWVASPAALLVSLTVGGWLNEHYGWRATFFIMGIPGLVCAILTRLMLVDPRMAGLTKRVENSKRITMFAALMFLWKRPSCRHLSVAIVLFFTVALGLSPWIAAFMMRSYHIGTAELGLRMGLVFGIAGVIGTLLGGATSMPWYPKTDRGQMRLVGVLVASMFPTLACSLLARDATIAMIFFVPWVMALNFSFGPSFALFQRLTNDESRATSLAVLMLVANVIGMGLGPQAVGIMSDLLDARLGQLALPTAMLAISALAIWAAAHFWRAGELAAEECAIGV